MLPAERAEFWRERPVLVTGVAGFVGAWLAERLLALSARVTCLVRDWVPESPFIRSGSLDRVTTVRGDLCDESLMERTIAEYGIDTVFHLAAQAIVGTANRSPIETFKTNIEGTAVLLDSCRRLKVPALVVASSDKAYGDHERLPYDESTPLRGRHPYDVSKSCADLLAQAYAATYGLPVAVTRCGNIYGGGDLHWDRIVPGTIRSLLRNERPVLRSDGTLVRDYLYAEDCVEAYLRTAEELRTTPSLAGEAFNFAPGKPLSVREVVDAIIGAMGSKLQPVYGNDAPHEIRRQYLDASKARAVLHWEPRVPFEEGIKRTIRWYRDYFSSSQPS